jgi:DNA-binding NtrC family response regulator
MERKEKNKILIVDDEEDTTLILAQVLKKEGYEVVTANNGQVALEIVENQRINLILTDIRMPHMDGMELLKNVKRNARPIPIILMTAHYGIDTYIDSNELGAFEYLCKPINIYDLKAIVQKALETPFEF